jgi:NAD(P)-dependent dehydrogenase (short-subunit alcohol dehydrogenase family)
MSLPDFSLKGKVAVVTGARRGISKTIALGFAEAGADVAVCDIVTEDGELAAVAEEIKKLGRRSMTVQVDVSHKSEVENMAKKVKNQFGAIDILMNGAAINYFSPLLDTPEDMWDKETDINLKGTFLCGQAVGRIMKEQKKGSIINIASDLAFYADHSLAAYCAIKAGVVMLTRVLSRELGSYGVRANCIAPGLTRTEMGRKAWEDAELLEQIEGYTSLGRIATTDDFIAPAIFLASDASSYITGNTLLLNGGRA